MVIFGWLYIIIIGSKMKRNNKILTAFLSITAISIGTFWMGRVMVREGAKYLINATIKQVKKINA
jgi:hypothetical protein